MLEHGGSLARLADELPCVTTRRTQIVVGQLVDMESLVVFGGGELIGLPVIIHKHGLVAAHRIVGTEAAEIFERTRRGIAYCHACGSLSIIGALHVGPHHEFARFWIVDHLRALQHLGWMEVARRIFRLRRKHDSLECPVHQVRR